MDLPIHGNAPRSGYARVSRGECSMEISPVTLIPGIPPAQACVLSPSSISTGLRCAREFLLAERLKLIRRGTYSDALAIGSLYHAGRAATLRGEDIIDAIEKEGEYVSQPLVDATDPDTQLLPNGIALEVVIEKIEKCLQVSKAMAAAAVRLFPNDPTGEAGRWSIPRVEEMLIDERNNLKGKMDALMLDEGPSKHLWIRDHKTTSDDARIAARYYGFSHQFRLYRRLLPDSNVKGVLLEVIKKPTIRQKKTESLDEYVERVALIYEEALAGDPAGRDNPWFHQRWVPLPEHDPELDNIVATAQARAHGLPILSTYPRNADACVRYGSVCPFLPLCEQEDPKEWPPIIEEKFRVRTPREEKR
jgi:hypothetical protein